MNSVRVSRPEQRYHHLQRTFIKQRRTESVAVSHDVAHSIRSLDISTSSSPSTGRLLQQYLKTFSTQFK